MTPQELERRVRAWSRAEGDPAATMNLRAAVLTIPDTVAVGHQWFAHGSERTRLIRLLIAGALLGAALGGGALVLSSGDFRLPWDRSINHPDTVVSFAYGPQPAAGGPGPGVDSLNLLDLDSGASRPLANVAGGGILGDPAWAPDRTSIAFIDQTGLRVVQVPSGSTRDYGFRSEDDPVLAWSPDGSALAVSGRRSVVSPLELQVVDVRTGSNVTVGSGAVPATLPWSRIAQVVGVAWTPSSDRLAYLVQRTYCVQRSTPGISGGSSACGEPRFSDQGCQLVIARPNGLGRPLAHDLGSSCHAGASGLGWIDDRRMIAAIDGQLLVIDADTGTHRALHPLSNATSVELSPDRQRIALLRQSFELDSASVAVEDLAGTARLHLDVPCGGACSGLSWSPDGRRLLLTSFPENGDSPTIDAWLVDASDGALTGLTIANPAKGFAWFGW
jgi:dipeptidyl aminopeptidase/acylaminoacyl peptidase